MTIKAIEKYGYHEEADAIAEKVISQQLAAYRNIEPHTTGSAIAQAEMLLPRNTDAV